MRTPLRFGLIGVGRWGQVYIKTLLSLEDRCRITHLCTRHPEKASLVPYPVTVVSDWRTLLRSNCDAVIIASPPAMHGPMLEACLEAGKPCIVEKPLCVDLETAERVHQRVQASGVPVLVDHTHLFNSRYRQLKRAVRESGDPLQFLLSEGMDLGPFRPDTPTVWDWCPHDFSLCFDVVGHAPTELDVLGGSRGSQEHPEQLSIRLEFPGSCEAWVQVSRISPFPRRSLSLFTDQRLFVWDDLAAEPLTMSSLPFSKRYTSAMPDQIRRTALACPASPAPMVNVLTYFLEGLSGADQSYFGTSLAVEVTRWIHRCAMALAKERAALSSPSGRRSRNP